MTDPDRPHAPSPRPRGVTAVCATLIGIASIKLFDVFVTATVADDIQNQVNAVWEEANERQGTDVSAPSLAFGAGSTVLGAVAFIGLHLALATGVFAGLRAARVAAWALLPVLHFCSSAWTFLYYWMSESDMEGVVFDATRKVTPDWIQLTWAVEAVVYYLAAITVVALLTLPGSNRFFRRARRSLAPADSAPSSQSYS